MKEKKGISLIVLVITIIVMIILASAAIISLSNLGIIGKANDTLDKSNLNQVKNLATMAWADAYMDNKRTQWELEQYVLGVLEKNNVNVDDYEIIVTPDGVTVELGNKNIVAGLYETGTNYKTLITPWNELINTGMVVVNNGTATIGTVLPQNLPAKNANGFYYGVEYRNADMGIGLVFNEDGSVGAYESGVLGQTLPGGSAVYSLNAIDMSIVDWGVGAVSANGTMVYFSGLGLGFTLGTTAQIEGELVLPTNGSITSIGEKAFVNQTGLTGIKIPSSVTSIGKSAFNGCNSLENMEVPFVGATKDGDENTHLGYIFGANEYSNNNTYVPTSLKTIKVIGNVNINDSAFYECANLVNVSINKSNIIGDLAFYDCTSLTNVEFNKASVIGLRAFLGCANLINVKIPNSVKKIDANAFYECQKVINTVNGIKYVDKWVVGADDTVANVTLAEDTRGIADYALSECINMTSITIPEGVEVIGDFAFRDSDKLMSIIIPASVNYIGELALYYCDNLTTINVNENNKNYCSIDNVLYNKDKTKIILYPRTKADTNYTILTTVTVIGENTFGACKNLKSIVIPDSVTIIENGAFFNCTGLTSIEIPAGVKNIQDNAFQGCSNINTVYYKGILAGWCGIEFDKEYYGGDSNPCFYNAALYINGERLEQLIIPNTITQINASAFHGCSSITSVEIPQSVKIIEDYAFRDCENLTTINYNGTVEQWNAITKETDWNIMLPATKVTCTNGTVTLN